MHDMASTNAGSELNGSLDAPHHHDTSAHDPIASKRKRINELSLSQSRREQIQRDVLAVIERHDTTPSFLSHEFDANSDVPADEPAAKKARLSEPSAAKSSIATKLSAAQYTSLEQIKVDATNVSRELVSAIRVKANEQDASSFARPSVDELKQIHRVQALEALIKEIADKEISYSPAHRESDVGLKAETDNQTNGHAPDVQSRASPSTTGTVLTLFGNAPNPKQLFSSMQHATGTAARLSKGSELMVEEMSLPNGLAATRVMAAPGNAGKRGPTMEETFAPPYNFAPLQPPKSHKRSSTRESTITWEFKDPVPRNSRKGGYTVQSLTVGDWLSYGGLDPENDHNSPRERRKMRDRALSSGEGALQPLSKASLEETLAKEEEALFRRAFSSFAPSHDNAKALIPEETKNLVWWHKVGHRRFNETFAIDPALLDEPPASMADDESYSVPEEPNDAAFDTILDDLDEIDRFEPDELPTARSKTDVDQVLRDISELLETLASHQRIRNASLASSASASRTPISPTPILASRIGKPDEPAEDELSTYASLRRELAYLVLQLPPYAVAKLRGDQLAELAISKVIPLETQDVKGTLEEDQVSRHAKLAAMATATSIATLTRPNSSAGQHYNTTAQRTPAIGQAANTRYGQTTQYGPRTPAVSQYQRSVPPAQQYGTPSGPRPAYGQPGQYGRVGAPPPSYGQANASQYYQQRPVQQTPSNYGYNPHHEPGSQQRPGFSPQPMVPYQQRSQAGTAPAPTYSSSTPTQQNPYNPSGSAFKPTSFAPTGTSSQSHARPPYQPQHQQPGSAKMTQGQYPAQPQAPVNGYQHSPPPPQQHPPPIASRTASATPQPPSATPSSAQTNISNQPNGHP